MFFPAQNFRFSFAIDLAIYWENLDLHPYPLHAGTQARRHARTHTWDMGIQKKAEADES